ncbi:MFS transporter [Alicyclobacillus curvatus]|nr:MFS transporter [Alicyclobacillus curvatus]
MGLPFPQFEKRKLKFQIGTYVMGRAVSSIGDWIYIVALNILVLNRSGSPLAVSGLWIVPVVARFLVAGWSGSIADRLNQRRLMMAADVLRFIFIGAIPFVSSIWLIYLLILLTNSAGVFFGQASMPYMTKLVPGEWRKRVNGLVGGIRSGAMLVGPAIAGALMLVGSASFAIWADAVSFLASALTLALLPNLVSGRERAANETANDSVRQKPQVSRAGTVLGRIFKALPVKAWFLSLASDWRESLMFLRQQRLLLTVLVSMHLTGILAMGADSVEVVFAKRALHLGQVGYSTMIVFAGVGVLIGSLTVTALTHRLQTRMLLTFGMLLTQTSYLLYASSTGLWTAGASLVALGIFNAALGVGFQTFAQFAIPVQRMGRIMGLISTPVSILTMISMGLTGFASGHVPVRDVMLVLTTGSTLIALTAAVIILSPRYRTEFQTAGAGESSPL